MPPLPFTPLFAASIVAVTLVGCKPSAEPTATPATQDSAPNTSTEGVPSALDTDRATLSAEECTSQGGVVVGDIGDGAIHRPDYTCESGLPPLGSITPDPGGTIAVEGSVCCPV